MFADWKLPDDHYDLGVGDATLEQLQALAARLGRRGGPAPDPATASPSLWAKWIGSSMITLQELMRVCLFPPCPGRCYPN